MKIAIHNSRNTFSDRWVNYCQGNGIEYRLVNCYANNIIEELRDCDVLMWHHFQTNPRDILVAKPLLFALEQAGKKVFPDFRTNWHFDDKIGQKYLLEAIGAPLVPTYIFTEKRDAIEWITKTDFPKVFKLRTGAGSSNVMLVTNPVAAKKIIRRAFGRGFKQYNSWSNLKEIIRKFGLGKASFTDLVKRIAMTIYQPRYCKISGRQRGYVYFQDFVPNNDHDIRIVVIGNNAFAIKRLVRKNDFRASGSGNILYNKELFDENTIKLAFDLAERMKMQCVAFDFVFEKKLPKLLEISYGFVPEGYDACPGFWDKTLKWFPGKFDPYGWMIEYITGNKTA
jgi:glutathione synthase/RimK-type ligase-like ATP-grasp enzyme